MIICRPTDREPSAPGARGLVCYWWEAASGSLVIDQHVASPSLGLSHGMNLAADPAERLTPSVREKEAM